jgi:hypothetical protein
MESEFSEKISDEITKFNVPLFIEVGVKKKKKQYLNLNLYRNMPFHLNNNLKKEMKRIVSELGLDFYYEKFNIHYKLFLPDKRLRDISNVCCVIDKYVCDALVENGNVPDDNYQHLDRVLYSFGGVDIDDPRCEVEVRCLNT